ncbi:MAG: hypothetical protein PHG60_00585 [Candidatus Dojkabacteria bacterium]|jgi:hypothetical protein|nr:hypothetical protein [Candidatus Dojkabacteria bacterium]
MKKLILTLTIFIATLLPYAVLAQEQEQTASATTKYFNITMLRGEQSAWDKSVTYELIVTPKIDSPRTQILWDAPTNIKINPKHKEFIDMYNGETYTFKSKVKTDQSGNYEINVNLIAWQHDTNYANSVSDIITFNEDLLAMPIAENYTYSLIGKYLVIALLLGLVIWGGVILSKKGVESMKKWLTPPN